MHSNIYFRFKYLNIIYVTNIAGKLIPQSILYGINIPAIEEMYIYIYIHLCVCTCIY